MTGAHPKVVQAMMRHGTITLTMDTYGHLFPGQEADAVGQMRAMLVGPPEELRATGTDNAAVEDGQNQRSARRSSQDAKRCVQDAKRCDKETVGRDNDAPENDRRKRLRIAKLGEQVRDDASDNENSRGGTRTLTSLNGPGILSPVRLPIPPLGQASQVVKS